MDTITIDPKALRHWRKEMMGVTRNQLGGVLGVTGQTIFRWENEKKPFLATRRTLKDLLELMEHPSAYEILRRSEHGIPIQYKPHTGTTENIREHFDFIKVPEEVFELYDWARMLECEDEFIELISDGATIEQLKLCCYLGEIRRLELENNRLEEEIEALKGGE
tara:strand:- start:31 stop:522 length:492 start_codon:yes stop_codon:yes gene_type:complete